MGLDEDGGLFRDRVQFTDDYGEALDRQPNSVCSSLRTDTAAPCTHPRFQTHNLFNYFPSHTVDSVVAYANAHRARDRGHSESSDSAFDSDSEHRVHSHSVADRYPMDARTLSYLARQNPHELGTTAFPKPRTQTRAARKAKAKPVASSKLHKVGTKKVKIGGKNKKDAEDGDVSSESAS